MNDLVAIAQEFSPRFESGRDVVTIDVRGLDRLLGGAQTIGEELRREAARRGVRVHIAVAGTRTAALVLAVARPGLTVVTPGAEADALAPLAMGILEKIHGDHDVERRDRKDRRDTSVQKGHSAIFAISAFNRWGLKTLGEVAALPPADLSSRLGRAGLVWQALARGDDVRPLVPDAAEERFESSMDLEWPIEGLEPLSFVLTRLLEPLSIRLERRDRGVAVLHVQLGLVGGDLHARRLDLPSPMRDVRALRTLALLDLESHPPAAAVDRVAIVVDPTPGRVVQHTLFAQPQLTPEQLSTLLARLGAVMGQDRIGSPATVDSYRPGAFAVKPFSQQSAVASRQSRAADSEQLTAGCRLPTADSRLLTADSGLLTADSGLLTADSELPTADSELPTADCRLPTVALRRCRQPVPGRVAADAGGRPVRVTTDRRGFAGGAVVSASGPWRTSGEWWDTGGSADRTGAGGPGGAGREKKAESREARADPSHQPDPPHLPTHAQGGWDRDEWDVTLTDGGSYRVFMDRATGGWFIDAICD